MHLPSILSSTFVLVCLATLLSVCIERSQGDEAYNRVLPDSDELMNSAGNVGGPAQSNPSNEAKRSWQSLQGSWGKRAEREGGGRINLNSLDFGRATGNNYDDNEYELNLLFNMDPSGIGEPVDYTEERPLYVRELTNILRHIAATSSGLHQIPVQQPIYQPPGVLSVNAAEQKRAWKSMNDAWGKRLGNSDWNKFRGSWGKREPGWNNLKGLWGKRATTNNWNKLQSAWGKRNEY